MSEPVGVTILVVNHNNEPFLAAAIDSALGQSHPLCEVIAVDDCSTDNSVAVIAGYGNRIRSVLRTENGGQVEALNSAWPLAQYPILIFLDSDDLLLVHAAATVAARWMASAVKMQSPLVTIDQTGREIGHMYPRFLPHLDTTTIRAEFLRTGSSAISPASGNAYSRSLLETVTRDGGFDLENPRQYWMDTILACNAPFYGEVITLYDPIACYRIHDRNLYALRAVDSVYFTRMLDSLTLELEYFAARCRIWHIPFDPTATYSRSLWALECRLIADKLTPLERRSTKQSLRQPVLRILYRALRACFEARLPISTRIIRAGWLIGLALSPSLLARRLIALRFIAAQRAAWFERALITLLHTRAMTAGTARSVNSY